MGPMWIKLVVQSPIERGAVSDTKIEAQLVKSPTVSGHLTRPGPDIVMPRRAFVYLAQKSIYMAQQFWVMILGSELAQLFH